MHLLMTEAELQKLQEEIQNAVTQAESLEDLAEVHQQYFGRKGVLSEKMKSLAKLSPEEKPKMGALLNKTKVALEEFFNQRSQTLKRAGLEKELHEEKVDVTLPGKSQKLGHVHPLSQVQKEVEDIFVSMGFEIQDGPEVESEYYNFEGLNIPASHPARDMQDTFFIDKAADAKEGRLVLRTHTSPVQVRTMQAKGAPLRLIVPGRVFRYEATDATHDATFYQVEGLMIDKEISLAHLKGTMEQFLSQLFGKTVHVRFRPGYFPFVEPGLELDFACLICDGKGCKTCKQSGWVEFMGAGMVHPNVLRAGGIDPEEYQGWAFGFGLTRLVLMRYQIPDLRFLMGGDLRFLNQF